MRRLHLALLLVLAGRGLPGCGIEITCDIGEMRCLGDTVQTCNADHDWKDWLACRETGLTCTTDPLRCGGHGDVACCDPDAWNGDEP